MDQWTALRTFAQVVESGSLSAAARLLKVGQPAVSRTIATLERHLGSPLLLRTTRRVVVTEAGSRYYESIKPALEAIEEAEQALRSATAGIAGLLRVAAPVTFGRLHVVPHLGPFLDMHPRLRLELVLDDRPVDVIQERIDVALRVGKLRESRLVARRLAIARRVVVGSPGYLTRRGIPLTPADLHAHDIVTYGQTDSEQEWLFRSGTGTTAVRVPSRLHISAAEGVRAAVLSDLGLSVASHWMFRPELQSGKVMPVLAGYTLDPVELWAVLPNRRTSARTRAFLEFVQRSLEPPASA
jgi:DNA-binding transcriptional LysR family regulator